MVLPALKLWTLAMKTACKPVANRLKHQATIHPRFRQFIITIAQVNHRITTTMQRRLSSHVTDAEIRPLNEERAVHAAADLIGEIFVFSVAGLLLILEVQRSARSEARKEEQRKQEHWAIKQRQEDLKKEIENLKHRIEEMEQLARGQGLSGVINFRQGNTQNGQAGKAA